MNDVIRFGINEGKPVRSLHCPVDDCFVIYYADLQARHVLGRMKFHWDWHQGLHP